MLGNLRGYGPRTSNRWDNLIFSGEECNYELWEVKLLAYMRLKKLHEVIDPTDENADVDAGKNAEAFAELVQFLDDRSLGLIMRDAKDKGREALVILRSHYAGSGKPRIISLYTQLTSLRKSANENITDYIIRAETASTSLKSAGEKISDGLLIAMVLKGLPTEYKPFSVLTTQSDKVITFPNFKVSLRNFEENEKVLCDGESSSVMQARHSRFKHNSYSNTGSSGATNKLVCYACGLEGHKSNSKVCAKFKDRKYCNTCKSTSHADKFCRKKNSNNRDSNGPDRAAVSGEQSEYHSYQFKIDDSNSQYTSNTSFLVDTGATSHIVTDESMFTNFDTNFNPVEHMLELADGTKLRSHAQKRGTVSVIFKDSTGELHNVTLHHALFIPSFPTHIFSVMAATTMGSSVCFYPNRAELVTVDGTTFNVIPDGKLYFLDMFTTTKVYLTRDLEEWHSILGHCNTDDIMKLETVVDGMKISNSNKFVCEACILGKQTQTVNREPSTRATKPLEFVSTDVSGPIDPISSDGFRYVISFTDNYSGYIFLYLMRNKSDAAKALDKFLSDVSPIGKVRCFLDLVPESVVLKMRSDNGGEYMGHEFKSILAKNHIRHEQCAPYSPHQNGIAERGWRTLYDAGRCSLIQANLPKEMWPYALMNASHIRNRCFQKRTKQTPYFMLTGRKPDLSLLHVFGTICYTYQ